MISVTFFIFNTSYFQDTAKSIPNSIKPIIVNNNNNNNKKSEYALKFYLFKYNDFVKKLKLRKCYLINGKL